MKRVVHVIADGAPGGGTTMVMELLQHLTAAGFPTFLISEKDSMLVQQAESIGVDTKQLSFFSKPGSWNTILKLGKSLRALAPATVHLHGTRAAVYCAPALLFSKPMAVIYTVHGYHFVHRNSLRRALGIVAERVCSKLATTIVFVSRRDQSLAKSYRLAKESKTQLIPNGINLPEISVSRTRTPNLVTFLGRMVPQKRPELFLETASMLAQDGFKFRMIGGGPLEQSIREQAEQRGLSDVVEITGSVTRSEALSLLAESEVLVSTALWEGLPLAPMEAMSLGVPCVLSDIESHRELMDGLESPYLVGNDPEDYANAIRNLTGDSELRANLVSAAKEHIKTFSAETMLTDYFKLYAINPESST